MVLLGGIQTLSGPIVGATVFALLQDTVMRQTEYWRALLGVIILLLVLAFPGGIVGAVARCWQRAWSSGVMSVLSVRSLSQSLRRRPRRQRGQLRRRRGEFLAMIGPNGAGKSTCFNMINGQLAPDSGEILFDGSDIAGLRAARDLAARRRPHVSGRRHVRLDDGGRECADGADLARAARSIGCGGRRRACIASARSRCSTQVGMRDAADRPCRELAYGDVKRVELAIALANEPRLLLMDEPTAGMAPRERNELIALVKRLVVERGMSVLFTEHSMDVVFAFADRIIVLARGAADRRRRRRHRSAIIRRCARFISAPARPSPRGRRKERHERRHARGRRTSTPGTAPRAFSTT